MSVETGSKPFKVIGTRVPKLDAVEKVTGTVRYLPDLEVPGMVWGRILRTTVPHARIRRIDTRRAEALPGVLGIITGFDVEQYPFGYAKDHLALKRDVVRCIRDEVAAVAAETEEIAAEACRLIEVEYEELPAVFDPAHALRPEAPQIHPQFPGNLVNFSYKFQAGDVERAVREADVVVEGTYTLPYVTTACLGTMAAIAAWDPRGQLTMWSTTQIPFLYQRDLADALGITGDRIRVIQPPVGGNFGRGLDLYPIDIIAALLARHVQCPVKIVFDRDEEFLASPTREPCVFTLRTAARADGTLLARDARVIIDNGAYVSWGSTTPYVMMTTVAGFYRCPNIRFDTAIVYTNNVYSGSMRGYGNLESTFAIEAQMDDLAERLGLDRLEIRKRNANRPGDVTPQGLRITTCALDGCFDAVARDVARPIGRPPRPGWKRGIGYAGMFHVGGGARVYRSDGCGAIVKLDDFGKVSLITGASEIGQGSETVLAMIVAEELGIPFGRVSVVNDDTAVKPWDVGVHASRTTFIAGNAALLAARDVKRQLLTLAAQQLDEPLEELDCEDGVVFVRRAPSRQVAYEKVVRAGHFREGGQILMGQAFYDPPTQMLDKDFRGNVSVTYAFAAQAALVEVEEATGKIEVLRVASAHDVGRALNPIGCEGQIEGGIHMGLGYALTEELKLEQGRVLNPGFLDYKLLTAPDMPEILLTLIETVDEAGPFGAKGLGEAGTIPISAAVANAVKDAVGVRMTELPMTPERVYRALRPARARPS
ncbi:MAG TPA: xanthine dehydrogenase family protein molybdopterin-binding subunit [Methylomirabilota bacterium]|nr:xanthine dehydrogenase family protein molybdopterin-binding subunit [Methylomirabilota bacterium]